MYLAAVVIVMMYFMVKEITSQNCYLIIPNISYLSDKRYFGMYTTFISSNAQGKAPINRFLNLKKYNLVEMVIGMVHSVYLMYSNVALTSNIFDRLTHH